MDILPYGEQAVLVNFEQEISIDVHQKVMGLTSFLEQNIPQNRLTCIPAYASLTIIFSIHLITMDRLIELIQQYKPAQKNVVDESEPKVVPVCFDPVFALDQVDVEEYLKKEFNEIIDLFCNKTYRVFQLGFLPGFGYLGTLDALLASPRKAIPRAIVPAQSLGIAGLQAGIYPSDSPGGWQIIGKTPLSLFNLERETPFLFEVGMTVQFEPISLAKFDRYNG